MTNSVESINPISEVSTYLDETKLNGYGIIKKYDVRTGKNNSQYVDFTIMDSTGEVSGKFFKYGETSLSSKLYNPGNLVQITGKSNHFNGAFQIIAEEIRDPGPDIKKEDYVKSAPYSSEDMFKKITEKVQTFEDVDLMELTLAIYEKYKEKLMYYPAAIRMHHAVRGGLLYHTLSIMTLAEKVSQVYPQVDRDLLLCGAALHDIGKISEMNSNDLGVAGDYTVDGNLVGHLVRGAMIVRFQGTKLNTPDEKLRLIEHMLLSHHGKPEFGAAVKPMFLEAILLHELDEMDAKVYEFSEIESSVEPNTFSARQWALDDVKVYNPGRKDVKPNADL